jgi:hypothetical protein
MPIRKEGVVTHEPLSGYHVTQNEIIIIIISSARLVSSLLESANYTSTTSISIFDN